MSGVDLAQWLGVQLDADDDEARRGYLKAEPLPDYDGWDKNTVAGLPPIVAARVLREIEADRLLLAEYERAANAYPADRKAYDYESEVGRERTATLEWVVRLRATRFSDRPGYLPEWAPTA